ncbi:hypothetical protein [Proteus cibi]|uniref:hypothetical protein n=1 Tax=Proteus cibi TaxID=2050966 RepID=UPI000D69D09A|nr:hypothetical protein [Proteus cibi]
MKKLSNFTILTIIFFIFLFSYESFISIKYSYMGFLNKFSLFDFFISYSLLNFCFIYYIFIKDDFNRLICFFIIIFNTIPNSVLYSYQLSTIGIITWSLLAIPITNIILNLTIGIKFRKIKLTERSILFLLFSLMLLCLIPVILAHGIKLNFNVFLFKDIYDIRRESRLSNTSFSVYGYFWLAKVICPISIIYALEKKNKLLFIISSIVLLYLFMTTAHKSVFLTLFVILGFYIGANNYNEKYSQITKATLVLFLVILFLRIIIDFEEPESLLIRRLFFIPSLLNYYFFDFFQSSFTYYSNSYLSIIIDYPFDKTIPQLIGKAYFNSEEMSANNGYISDGYANLGHLGVFINICLASIVFKVLKNSHFPPKYFGLIFITIYAIQGSAFSTFLFTHAGILILILAPILFNKRNEK